MGIQEIGTKLNRMSSSRDQSKSKYRPLGVGSISSHELSETLIDARQNLNEVNERTKHIQNSFDETHRYPQLAVDVEQMLVTDDFVDENDLNELEKQIKRSSMLSIDVIKAMDERELAKVARNNNLINDVLLFILGCFIMSISGPFDEWLTADPITGLRRKATHLPGIQFLFSYLGSTTICLVLSYLLYGPSHAYDLVCPSKLLKFLPIALGFSFQEIVGARVTVIVGTSVMKVIGQMKLGCTAAIARIFMGRKLTSTQWLLIITMTCSIISYLLIGTNGIEIKENHHLFMAIVTMFTTVVVGLICEVYMKRESSPFIVQYGRTRLAGLICTIFLLARNYTNMEVWNQFPFGGFESKYWLIVLNNIIMCFVATAIVKHLDSLWKTLAGAFGLTGGYLMSIWLTPVSNKFSLLSFLVINAIATDVIAFASSKKDEMKLLQLTADIERLAQGAIA